MNRYHCNFLLKKKRLRITALWATQFTVGDTPADRKEKLNHEKITIDNCARRNYVELHQASTRCAPSSQRKLIELVRKAAANFREAKGFSHVKTFLEGIKNWGKSFSCLVGWLKEGWLIQWIGTSLLLVFRFSLPFSKAKARQKKTFLRLQSIRRQAIKRNDCGKHEWRGGKIKCR